jgi:hypothetical protein
MAQTQITSLDFSHGRLKPFAHQRENTLALIRAAHHIQFPTPNSKRPGQEANGRRLTD